MSYRAYVAAFLLAGLAAASEPSGTLISARSVAFDSQTGKTYVLDPPHDKLWIVNAAQHSSTSIDIGKRPAAVALNTKTELVYVTLSGEGRLAVLDGRTGAIAARLAVGPHPYALAINERENRIYVTNTFSDIVSVVHGSTNSVDTLHLGSSDNVAVDAVTNKIFLIGYEDPNLKIIDGQSGAVEKVQVGNHLWAMAVSTETGTVYLTRVGASQLAAVDEHTHAVRTASVGAFPCALALDDSSHRVFVVNYGDNSVTTLQTPELRVIAVAPAGSRPQSIALAPDSHAVFVAGLQSGTVMRIDGMTGHVSGTFAAGANPYGLGLTGSRLGSAVTANLADSPWTVVSTSGAH